METWCQVNDDLGYRDRRANVVTDSETTFGGGHRLNPFSLKHSPKSNFSCSSNGVIVSSRALAPARAATLPLIVDVLHVFKPSMLRARDMFANNLFP